jgi:tetratricopeptide (TPR) repeat protein
VDETRTLENRAFAGGHYSSVARLSRTAARGLTGLLLFIPLATPLLLLACSNARAAQSTESPPRKTAAPVDTKTLFFHGESALKSGDLDQAEHDFRQVIAANDHDVGAYANLGVIYMRRQQWTRALEMLHQAERLAPNVPGIHLNIGLAYFRQGKYASSIPAFEKVVSEQPDSAQARHLLGLCYFFGQRWADAAKTLEPLWAQESQNLDYLYVLGIAAGKAGDHALEERALGQLVQVGGNTPEFHLFMGKAFLNREEYDKAIAQLTPAAEQQPKLPFVHFNLGLAYLHKQEYERAKQEFEKDLALEPDVAYTYEALGQAQAALQQDGEAEKNFRHALRLDSHLLTARLELAKIYQGQQKYSAALAELDAAQKLDPDSYNVHFLRGQVLLRLGRQQEGRSELAEATRVMNTSRAKRQKELESGVPNPELTQPPQ